eukprot:scaffold26553_cov137-Cylindrotheca_fusiformis.AAC.1
MSNANYFLWVVFAGMYAYLQNGYSMTLGHFDVAESHFGSVTLGHFEVFKSILYAASSFSSRLLLLFRVFLFPLFCGFDVRRVVMAAVLQVVADI